MSSLSTMDPEDQAELDALLAGTYPQRTVTTNDNRPTKAELEWDQTKRRLAKARLQRQRRIKRIAAIVRANTIKPQPDVIGMDADGILILAHPHTAEDPHAR